MFIQKSRAHVYFFAHWKRNLYFSLVSSFPYLESPIVEGGLGVVFLGRFLDQYLKFCISDFVVRAVR